MNPTIENILISALVTLAVGFPLSAYAGVIVARYWAFEMALNQARSMILNLQQAWEYRYLEKAIPDPESSTGRRTVFMSKDVSSDSTSWQLMQIGLQLKEGGHWKAAQAIDAVALEMDELRDSFVSQSRLTVGGAEREINEYIADWHRTLSAQKPALWRIVKPWPNKRYQHLSCVSVNETTGEWHEVEPERRGKDTKQV
jgi:hypothetical protein